MDLSLFSPDAPGDLVPISGTDGRTGQPYDHLAFVPQPLPDRVELSHEAWTAVTAAMQALGRVDQASRNIPNPGLLRRPSLRREAQSTSALEGTHALFSDVLEADAGGRVTPEIREVLNYAQMAEYAIEAMKSRDITVGLLCELNAMLVQDTQSDGPEGGRIRESQVLIGPEGCRVEEARFVPPPPGDLLVAGFRQWADWLSTARPEPIVVQAALAHYQFETLHPFHDGNGRIGRLVILLQLLRTNHLRDGLLTLSPWLETRRREYQDGLLHVSHTGEWNEWITFFCRAIEAEANSTVQRVDRLLEKHRQLRSMVFDIPIRGVAGRIAEELIAQPIITPTFCADQYNMTYQGANKAVGKLVELGIIVEMTGRTYDRVFVARDILQILQA